MLKLVKKHIVILGISLSITMVACPVVSKARTTAENNKQESFINEIAPYAKKVQHEHHILSSIIISQAILESNWGTSKLAKQGKISLESKVLSRGMPFICLPKNFEKGIGSRLMLLFVFIRAGMNH
ncbi:Exo-glucosaminidase lytG precursor [Listeria grayi]|uniref:Exo-glucosaminidase lytG n=1 Tax=Listeria grayi TaxID=1641 RepID=A0A378MBD9_LISGR|nr:Exo-glucosaminidase lytG precursor [Listeria grayi]